MLWFNQELVQELFIKNLQKHLLPERRLLKKLGAATAELYLHESCHTVPFWWFHSTFSQIDRHMCDIKNRRWGEWSCEIMLDTHMTSRNLERGEQCECCSVLGILCEHAMQWILQTSHWTKQKTWKKKGTRFSLERNRTNKMKRKEKELITSLQAKQTASVYGIFRNLTFRYTQVKDYDLKGKHKINKIKKNKN